LNFRRNHLGANTGSINICDKCRNQFELRDQAVARVVESPSPKKLIVAGPGTGKTHTFRKLVESLPAGSRVVIFTLINNLVDDLRELEQIADREVSVFTFHGFCKSLLFRGVGDAGDFSYTAALPDLVNHDAELLDMEFQVPAEQALSELREDEDSVRFFLDRADYYGAVGYVDSVYRVLKFFREHSDAIPEYQLVIADEYQDFNRLEASLIELLASKSSVAIAGDDDQALYAFRFASHEFIRALFSDDKFEHFNLPLCSRCPPVLVDAANAFIEAAKAKGNLKGRIPKDFECYWPDKFVEHAAYARIAQVHCSQKTTVELLIENEIKRLYEAEKNEIDSGKDIPFLVIGPMSRHQLRGIYEHLAATIGEDFELDMPEKSGPTISEGYDLLRNDSESNLGWRIVMFHSPLEKEEAQRIIRETYESNVRLVELLPNDYKQLHLNAAQEQAAEEEQGALPAGKPKVKFTTFLGAKGLSARHVFVVGLNNGEFPERPKATDAEVCEFIVALTRAKSSCWLISNNRYSKELHRQIKRPSNFLSMIPAKLKQPIIAKVSKGVLIKI
jgi:superfamily I DNA/RNA helicase